MFLRGRGNNSSLREARSHVSAACDIDYAVVLSKTLRPERKPHLEKPPTKLKSCIVNMRDPSKRCNFGLKLDDFKACQRVKVTAAGQHHDLVWKKLWTAIYVTPLPGNIGERKSNQSEKTESRNPLKSFYQNWTNGCEALGSNKKNPSHATSCRQARDTQGVKEAR